jgi:3-keto-disaccharide hydrolase
MKTQGFVLVTAALALFSANAQDSMPLRSQQPLIMSAAATTNAVSPTTRVDLFNGKDFTGWTFFMRTNADPKQTWSIEDGLIQCTGKPTGYMRTAGNYRDYRVTVEWRFTQAGNTGVMVHMQEPDAIWPATIECQGAHNQQGDFWMQGGATCKDHTTRETRRFKMPEPSNEKPVGEWNTFTVECAGNTVRIFVNGKLMNTATDCSVSSGHIGLQSEGAGLEIRKVFLEPLEN